LTRCYQTKAEKPSLRIAAVGRQEPVAVRNPNLADF
jgi:hypothetical protein